MQDREPSRGARLTELDALRGIAVLAVLLYHYTTRFDELYGDHAELLFRVTFGHYGVHFFFVISGFVIAWTTERSRDWRDFFVSRFSRLWPAYAAGVVLTTTLVHVFGLPGREISYFETLVNFSMIQDILGFEHVDGAYWSLQVELLFYFWICAALVFRVIEARWLLAVLGCGLVMLETALQRELGLSIPSQIPNLTLVNFFAYFAIGVLLFEARRDPAHRMRCWALLPLCVASVGYVAGGEQALVAVVATATVLAASAGWLPFLRLRPLVWMGSISYSLYLVHQNIGYVVIRELLELGLSIHAAIALATLFAILLATLLQARVEAPAQRAIRSAYRRWRERDGGVKPEPRHTPA